MFASQKFMMENNTVMKTTQKLINNTDDFIIALAVNQ